MKHELAMEIIQPDQFWSVISYLPNPADLWADKVSFYRTVDEMILDAKIGSHLRLRKDIVTSFPFVIRQGNASDEVYEFIRDNLTANLNWETDVKEFLTAIEYGHSFSEVLWKENGQGKIVPDSLRNKYPEDIVYKIGFVKTQGGKKSVWVPVLKKTNEELNTSYKFLSYRNNPRAENPYGFSDLLMCYWPWKFKQLGWEFWLKAAQKAGVPSLVALFDAPDGDKARKNAQVISDTLSELGGGDGLALANVKELKVLEMSGALRDHKTLIDTCNQEISFALTTQSLSTQEGEFGTRAQATVHDENLVRVCHGDALALQGVFQRLIDWMVEINFGKGLSSPKGEFDLQSYASFEEIMQAIQNKIPVSKEALYTRYKLPRPKNAEDEFVLTEIQNDGFALSDRPSKKKRPLTRTSVLAQEEAKAAELESLAAASKKRFLKAIQNTVKIFFNTLSKNSEPPKKEDLKAAPLPDFNSELFSITMNTFASSLLIGMEHAAGNISLADDTGQPDLDISFSVEPLPFEEAIDFFKGKVSLTKEEWEELEPKLRFRAFTVARLAEADHIEMLRGRLLHAMEKGEYFAETWKDVKAFTEDADQPFSARYFETVYRTNVQSAYNAGRLMQYQNNMPPAWELLFIKDGRTSDICRGLASIAGNGKALAASHSFWSTYGFPPYHFNCRTTFRAVYDYEIGRGMEIENVPMNRIRQHFKPQEGFGGNPIEKESWWRLTDKMKERIERYGIKEEVETAAKAAGIDNFDVRLAHNKIKQRRLQGTDFKANIIEGAEPKQHEVEIAKILKENGYDILFTPENTFIDRTKNPEGIITNRNKVVEMKRITSSRLDKISERMEDASNQNAEIAVLHLQGKKEYKKGEAFQEVRKTFKDIENKDKKQNDKTESKLKEVWLLWEGKLSKIKK